MNEKNLHPQYALEYWKLKAMFDGDPSFKLGELDDYAHCCEMWCQNSLKKELFEDIVVPNLNALEVQCVVDRCDTSCEEDVAELFSTNPHFSRLHTFEDGDLKMQAVLFKPECIHYFSDDMFSPTGHTAILPQDLARELTGAMDPEDGEMLVNIKTDLED